MSEPKALPPIEVFNPPRQPPKGRSCLITKPSKSQLLTSNRETDARTALKRGLKEYLETLSFTAPGGRTVAFERVVDVWADHEVKVVFPSAIVYSIGEGSYDASGFTPSVSTRCVTEDGFFISKFA